MTKAELIDRIARSRDLPPDISKKLIGQVLGIAFDELAGYFARSRVTRSQSPRFTFPRFGTFTKKRRSARRGVNPRTLEPIQIEACDTVDFKVSRELREAMNPSPKADSELSEAPPEPRRSARGTSKAATKAKKSARTSKKKVSVKKTKSRTLAGPSRQRLNPRDDEMELSAMLDEPSRIKSLDELPRSPMQRVKGRRRTRSKGTG